MDIGSRVAKGRKELVLVLAGDEIENFHDGKEIVKQSGDAFGDFSVTVVVGRKVPVHPQAKKLLAEISLRGSCLYDGWKITAFRESYTTDGGHQADNLNELLHKLDTHPDADFVAERVNDKGKAFYNGVEVTSPFDDEQGKFVWRAGDDTFDRVVSALAAIDRGEVRA